MLWELSCMDNLLSIVALVEIIQYEFEKEDITRLVLQQFVVPN